MSDEAIGKLVSLGDPRRKALAETAEFYKGTQQYERNRRKRIKKLCQELDRQAKKLATLAEKYHNSPTWDLSTDLVSCWFKIESLRIEEYAHKLGKIEDFELMVALRMQKRDPYYSNSDGSQYCIYCEQIRGTEHKDNCNWRQVEDTINDDPYAKKVYEQVKTNHSYIDDLLDECQEMKIYG